MNEPTNKTFMNDDVISCCGKIISIIGPMFSGKTTELNRLIRIQKLIGKKTIIIKKDHDYRENEKLDTFKTHNNKFHKCIRINNLMSFIETSKEFDVIGIDDCQFFGRELVTFCTIMANKYHKMVIVSGLDSDFKMDGFIHVLELIPKSEEVYKLKAMCLICKKKEASFSYKKKGDFNKRIELGDDDLYGACCRLCHNKQNEEI